MPIDDFIPSMFHRRLLMLGGCFALALVPLGFKLGNLTLVKGSELRAEAEARLVQRMWIPTHRGRILDRKGRVLAMDRAVYDVRVEFESITGEWARDKAWHHAVQINRGRWSSLSDFEREEIFQRLLPRYQAILDRMWDDLAELTGVERAEIDEERARIDRRVRVMHEEVRRRRRAKEMLDRRIRGESVSADDIRMIEERVSRPIAEQEDHHVIARGVTDETGFRLLSRAEELLEMATEAETGSRPVLVSRMPGLEIRSSGAREYPFDAVALDVDRNRLPAPIREDALQRVEVQGVGIHMIGWMRDQIYREDLDRRLAALDADPDLRERATARDGSDRGGYLATDRTGSVGLEASFENTLRGLRGVRWRNLDTNVEEVVAPEPGGDVQLAIDVMLQARIQAIMTEEVGLAVVQPWQRRAEEEANPFLPDGTSLPGAAVVIDIDSGDILAAVSSPTFTREDRETRSAEIFNDARRGPARNRAFGVPYPPGSPAKALMVVGAMSMGALTPEERFECTGHLYPDLPNRYRCWIWRPPQRAVTHADVLGGPLDAVEALMVSCNIYFYHIGSALGPDGVQRVYRHFGVNHDFDLGLSQVQGQAHPMDTLGVTPNEAIMMGIGQGPVTWTPLHAASAYATMARAGRAVAPRLVYGQESRAPVAQFRIDPYSTHFALEGLHRVVNDDRYGTARHLTFSDGTVERIFTADGVDVWGKTGTAQSALVDLDPSPEGTDYQQLGDHSWFVMLVGREGDGPRYAVAVIMEHGGSGGRVSGPVANQIIYALMDEGYL